MPAQELPKRFTASASEVHHRLLVSQLSQLPLPQVLADQLLAACELLAPTVPTALPQVLAACELLAASPCEVRSSMRSAGRKGTSMEQLTCSIGVQFPT